MQLTDYELKILKAERKAPPPFNEPDKHRLNPEIASICLACRLPVCVEDAGGDECLFRTYRKLTKEDKIKLLANI